MSSRNLADSIQELLTRHHLLSANELLAYFATEGHRYNKTSVYRALDQLAAAEIICRYDFQDREAQYELRNEHHDHLVCEKCGKILVADCQFTQPEKIAGFTISHHHLTLFGLCENCEVIF